MNPNARRRAVGFSLIELLVTMGIVTILAAIAYPSYQNHVMRTHRNAAKACLSQYAQFMERYYTTNLSYEDAEPDFDSSCAVESQLDTRYTFAFAANEPTPSTYIVLATPVAGSPQARDGQCAILSINQAGVRNATGTLGNECW